MNELSRHIERLLLSSDCVVVPQFGGFVTMATSATREEVDEVFFPPIRVVRFNPELTEDDGLLIADVQEQRHCSETEAKRHVQRLVLDLRQQLLADGQMDFGSIGMFSQDEDGRVSFSSCQAGVTTPEYFGLDAFVMHKLTAAQRSGKFLEDKQKREKQEGAEDSNTITIHISRRGLKNVVAAAAIILLCVLFSSPFDEKISHSEQATLLPSDPIAQQLGTEQQEVKATPITPSAAVAETNSSELVGENVQAQAEKLPSESPSVDMATANNYCIVLASQVSRKNAEHFVETLKEMGFSRARIYDNGKMLRVIIDGFETEAEAYNMNSELHQMGKEYASTWVMEL